jgi:hypothetical protein
MKLYYSVIKEYNEIGDYPLDDYVIETEFCVVKFDAITGNRLETYDSLAEYMLLAEPISIVQVEF